MGGWMDVLRRRRPLSSSSVIVRCHRCFRRRQRRPSSAVIVRCRPLSSFGSSSPSSSTRRQGRGSSANATVEQSGGRPKIFWPPVAAPRRHLPASASLVTFFFLTIFFFRPSKIERIGVCAVTPATMARSPGKIKNLLASRRNLVFGQDANSPKSV